MTQRLPFLPSPPTPALPTHTAPLFSNTLSSSLSLLPLPLPHPPSPSFSFPFCPLPSFLCHSSPPDNLSRTSFDAYFPFLFSFSSWSILLGGSSPPSLFSSFLPPVSTSFSYAQSYFIPLSVYSHFLRLVYIYFFSSLSFLCFLFHFFLHFFTSLFDLLSFTSFLSLFLSPILRPHRGRILSFGRILLRPEKAAKETSLRIPWRRP